jgi:nucleotide-binding universal stress UspA family protein
MSRLCASFSPPKMKILIAYDGSEFAEAILDDLPYAGLPARVEVVVFTLAEPEYFLVGKKTEGVAGWLNCKLTEARMSARLARDCIQANFPDWDASVEVRIAAPAQEIVRKATQWNPDLVIIGQHGRGGSKLPGLGRIAKCLLKEANCSVRIARERRRPRGAPPRIVIPLTASQNLEALARVVTSRLWPLRTEVRLVDSLGPILSEMRLAGGILDPQTRAVMEIRRSVKWKLQSANLLVASKTTAGFSAADVIETARRWRADCIFIGAEEMSLIEKVFCGDFVARVASQAECSVEIVRGPVRCGAEFSEGAAGASHKDFLPVTS